MIWSWVIVSAPGQISVWSGFWYFTLVWDLGPRLDSWGNASSFMNWYVAKWIIGDRKFVDDWSNPPLNNIKERRRRCCLWLSIHSTTGPMFERNMTFCFYLKMSGFYIRLGKWRWDWKCDAWCQIQFCLLQLWNLEIASLEYRKTFVFYSQWRNTCKFFFQFIQTKGIREAVAAKMSIWQIHSTIELDNHEMNFYWSSTQYC